LERVEKLVIIELTVPFELGIDKAHSFKCNKYAPLVSDIESSGYQVELIAIEIGSRGYISPDNIKRAKAIHKMCNKPVSFKNFRNNLSKLAIVSSFSVFYAKHEPTWMNPPFLEM